MDKNQAAALDANDPLAGYRDQFILPGGEVYLDGNSLGPLLHAVRDRLMHTIDQQWGQRLIRSWNEGWIDLPHMVAGKIAPIVGANPEDLVCADSVSVNLFKVMAASLMDQPERTGIVSVRDMFPTDLYMSEGLSRLLGKERCQLTLTNIEALAQAINAETNLLVLSQVNFRTGESYDVEAITSLAHAAGVRVLWDLSHSAGVLPVNLLQHDVDFAVGCGYKFLNGGPGAPAFVFVHPRLQGKLQQPLSGWMGHAAPFDFDPGYQPAPGMAQFLAGTPGVLGMSALDAALDIWQDLSLQAVFEKSQQLTGYFIELLTRSKLIEGVRIIRPANRGSQVSLSHEQAFPISQALIAEGIICDFRAPDLIRFGFAPLYTSYQDVANTVSKLEKILVSKRFTAQEFQVSGKVT